MNPYEVLQLSEDATYEQIKQRYRHLSKMVHPDKHPIENYQIAQARFKEIDEAYKSISNELRRYIYKHYGSTGITIIENNPFPFIQYEKADLSDPTVLNRLNQLMIYCLYEQHASNEIDKNKLRTKTIMLVYKPLNNINQLPSIQKSQFSFETSLPDFWGMTHTANISHASEGLSSTTKSGIVYGISSSKRIQQSLMLNVNTHISSDRFGVDAGVDKIINNNLVFHFIPLNFDNGQLGSPQVGADFHRDNVSISGITDFNSFTIQLSQTPPNKSVTKMIKFGFDDHAFVISPLYERDITSKLRIFTHFQFRGERAQPTTTNISLGLVYGYRMKIFEQLKLELSSFIGSPHSNFQISIITPKFKVSIPIFCKADIVIFQLYKLGAFFGIYLSFQLYNYYTKKGERRRKRIQYENYNRLSVQKNAIAKNNNDFSNVAAESRENQIKYEGLVILLAYLGSSDSIARTKRKIKEHIDFKNKKHFIDDLQAKVQKLKQEIKTNEDAHENQLYEITDSLQAKVKGAQLLEYNVEELRVNPCMDEKQSYYSLIFCYLREKVIMISQKSSIPIKIGLLEKHYSQPWYLAWTNYLKKMMVN